MTEQICQYLTFHAVSIIIILGENFSIWVCLFCKISGRFLSNLHLISFQRPNKRRLFLIVKSLSTSLRAYLESKERVFLYLLQSGTHAVLIQKVSHIDDGIPPIIVCKHQFCLSQQISSVFSFHIQLEVLDKLKPCVIDSQIN